MNSVVYLNKKIEFCSGSIRAQVYEMWAQGGKVACGVVTDNTKVRGGGGICLNGVVIVLIHVCVCVCVCMCIVLIQ